MQWMRFLAAATCAAIIGTAVAQERARLDHLVRNDFFAGFQGDQEALARGIAKCEEVLKQDPNHAEALVWHGAGLYFRVPAAFAANDRQRGIQLYMQAMQEMERAVALQPDSVGVRIPRGAVLLAATRSQNPDERTQRELRLAISDYQAAFDLQKDRLHSLGAHPKGELLMGLADGYDRLGDAAQSRRFLQMVVESMGGSVYAKRASRWLAGQPLPAAERTCVGCHSHGQ